MYYIIKRYQKKLLAVFAVLLMVAFVATLGVRGPTTAHYDPVVAKAGDASIKDSEMRRARDEWQLLYETPVPDPRLRQMIRLPYLALPESLVSDIKDHPELFLLLQLEARRDGISIDPDQARSVATNEMNVDASSPRFPEAVRAAESLLLVQHEINRLNDAIKVSAPEWQHAAAQEYSTVRLNLIDFKTSEFEAGVAVPTPEQLRQQFEKYKNAPPTAAGEQPPKDNPLGFGYQIPARVKLQYVTIPHAQIVQAVKGDANHQYELQVQAADYYQKNQEEFRNTPPASQPTSQPTTGPATTQTASAASQPATTQAASTQPAIKPFAEVKEQIIDKLIATDVEKKTAQIEKDVASRLAGDWIAIRKADPSATQPASTQPATTQPTDLAATAPASQPAGDLRSLAHLEQLRDDIQKQYGVQVELHDIAGTWQGSAELAKLPGIGGASTAPPSAESFVPGVAFPQYALSFTQKPGASAVVPLQVWEPSQPLSDAQENAYVFRLTAAQVPHAPPDMSAVADRVTADWRTAQAYDQAKQAAQKLLDAAKTIGLSQAARNASFPVQTIGPFLPRGSEPIPKYPLDAAAREQLGKAADDLIKSQTAQDKHPAALAELPTARRVAVIELAGTQLRIFEWYAQMQATTYEQSLRFRKLAQDYFAYDQVVSRMQYKPEETAKRT